MTVLRKHLNYIMAGIAILATCTAVGFWASRDVDTHRETEDTNNIVRSIEEAVKQINDNASKNTIILCTIILSQNVTISEEDKAEVEAICKQRVNGVQATQTTEDTAPSNPVNVPSRTSDTQSSPVSFPNNNSTSTAMQPNNSQQPTNQPPSEPPDEPESLLPLVKEPVVGCVTERLCL
jgi:hypothetical protein